jgi:hypothetical protein
MTDHADAVGELGTTGRRVTDCGAIEKSRTVEVEQTLLRVTRFAVYELSELG